MRILLIENERPLALNIVRFLTRRGWATTWTTQMEEGISILMEQGCDVVIIEGLLAKRNNWDVIHQLRRRHVNTPIMIVSSNEDVQDIVKSLEAGADEYMIYPFDSQEFGARVLALGRRDMVNRGRIASIENVTVDFVDHQVWVDGELTSLTPHEYGVLEELALHQGKVVETNRIQRSPWLHDGTPLETLQELVRSINAKITKGRKTPFVLSCGDGLTLANA